VGDQSTMSGAPRSATVEHFPLLSPSSAVFAFGASGWIAFAAAPPHEEADEARAVTPTIVTRARESEVEMFKRSSRREWYGHLDANVKVEVHRATSRVRRITLRRPYMHGRSSRGTSAGWVCLSVMPHGRQALLALALSSLACVAAPPEEGTSSTGQPLTSSAYQPVSLEAQA